MREAQGTNGHSEHTDLVTNSCPASLARICFTGVSDSSAINDTGSKARHSTRTWERPRRCAGHLMSARRFHHREQLRRRTAADWKLVSVDRQRHKVFGNHTLKFGGDVRRMRFDQTLYFEVSGYEQYFGGGPTIRDSPATCYPNYLLGLVDQYQQGAHRQKMFVALALLVRAG